MNYAALIGAIIQVAGPVTGYVISQIDRDRVLKLLEESRDELGNLDLPKFEKLVAEEIPPTELAKIQSDPRLRAQQQAADRQLDEVIDAGGLTLNDRAALNQIRNRVSRSEAAGRNAITQDMARRGTLDSGAHLAMSLANQQQAANQAAEAGEQQAGNAQRRAYEAILARSRLAGEGLDRDWRQKSQVAQAQDAINRGNAEIRNLTSARNRDLAQRDFENRRALARDRQGARTQLSDFYSGRSTDTRNLFAQGGKAAGQGVAAMGEDEDDYEDYLRWKKQQGGA